jgi:putative nucleotidyltransferase with HDIG domain|tara:strand:+ start:2273 stop:4747 length:2475 start_codon:yes stop_codon:yes gene_type:complete
VKEEKKEAIRKNIRGGRRRRVSLDDEVRAQQMDGFSGFWTRWGKHLLQTIFFGVTIILICFVGQEPPGLRTLGEVAPENVYSDRSFSYLSEVRKRDAEEWIRSSTPREFTRDFVGEENFAKAMVRLREGLLAIAEITDDSKELALESLVEELKIKFQVVLSEDEARALLSTSIMRGEAFFNLGNKLLSQLHLTGVVKFPSVDQKFLSESNASARINSQMIEFANSLVVYDHENNTRLSNSLIDEYHFLSSYLKGFDTNSTSDFTEVLSGKASVQLREIIEFGDENASFAAQEFRNDIAGELGAFLAKGLRLRSIDRKATTAAQERAIADMEPTVISVQEGEIILRRGDRVTAADLEKYQEYLDLALEDSVLLPKRIFVTIVTLLFGVVYISLVLPKFWSDGPRSNIVALSIVSNLGISRFIMELGETELFGESPILIGLLPYLLPIAFAPMIVMITVGPRMATLTAIMTCVFHAAMQEIGIEMLVGSLCTALVGVYFCREVRLRGSVLKAGTMAGITGGVVALGIGFASGTGWMVPFNHALASFVVAVFTGALVLGAMPLIEKVFNVATDATLFELTDYNHPLLRKMQVEAPGTYHHSLMVANLAEDAALVVKANPTLCRACALFHDIGKMVQPNYFTENQGDFGNPHNRQNPAMSALIIKSHVKEGLEIARENRLPKVIRDVIRQHHGTTLVKYFYFQAKQKSKQASLPYGDSEMQEPDESTYRYDGPRPRFKESAIIFFADSVEAAARSLPKVTHHSVEELLDSIFQDRLEDGQLDECPLTLEEVATIKKSFLKTTLNMLHSRIEYPDEEKDSRHPFPKNAG